jgi:hypothetical protein
MLLRVLFFIKGDDGLSGFCTACGAPLQENVRFCTGCGAPVTEKGAGNEGEQKIPPMSSPEPVTKEGEQGNSLFYRPALSKTAAQLFNTGRAAVTAGEMALPQEMFPLAMPEFAGPFAALGSGLKRMLAGFKAAFGDKKRLIPALVLAVWWIVFIFLPPAVKDAFPAKILSWLTFAQGGLQGGFLNMIGGIVGKGLLAAFFTSLIIDKSTLGRMKAGISAVTGGLKGDRSTLASCLLGTALALILYNIIAGSTSLQNSMAAIACLGLSLGGLAGSSGFARQFFTSLFYKKSGDTTGINRFMAGWAAGFAIAFVFSLLPGGYNGYILGGIFLILAVIVKLTGRNREEVAAQ